MWAVGQVFGGMAWQEKLASRFARQEEKRPQLRQRNWDQRVLFPRQDLVIRLREIVVRLLLSRAQLRFTRHAYFYPNIHSCTPIQLPRVRISLPSHA